MAKARKAVGVTQQRLAEHLEVSTQQLSKYERGKNRMSKVRHDRATAYLAEKRSGRATGFAEERQTYLPATLSIAQLVNDIESAKAALDRALRTARQVTS